MPNGRGEFFYGNGDKALDKYVGDFVDGAVSENLRLWTMLLYQDLYAIQAWVKKLALGCVNPAPDTLLSRGQAT